MICIEEEVGRVGRDGGRIIEDENERMREREGIGLSIRRREAKRWGGKGRDNVLDTHVLECWSIVHFILRLANLHVFRRMARQ